MRRVILTAVLCVALTTPAHADELEILSHVIYGEAGNCGWDMMVSVGSVVLNRKADPRFPDTLEEVVFQEGQYACTWDGNYYLEPSQEAVETARFLLEEGTQIDPSVVWQAEFPQGNGVYDTIQSPWGTTMYFCY